MFEDREALLEQISRNTVKYRIKEWVDNFMTNVKSIQGGYGVCSLKDGFQFKPCIVVGAGPTLDWNIQHLVGLQDKACIIACDSALHALLDVGVIPHIVLVTDSKQKVLRFLKEIDISQISFIADTFTHPNVIEVLQKAKRLYWYSTYEVEMEPFTGALNEWTGYIGHIGTGGCVATTIWSFAYEVLGCDPIILVGLPEGFYDPGQQYATSILKHQTMESYESETFEERDMYGRVVYTKAAFRSFAYWFQDAFLKSGIININCSEGGIIRENCCIMPLQHCATRYLTTVYDVDNLVFAKEARVDDMLKVLPGEAKSLRAMMTILLDGPSVPNLELRTGWGYQEIFPKVQWLIDSGCRVRKSPYTYTDKHGETIQTSQLQLEGINEVARDNMRQKEQQGAAQQEHSPDTGQADGVVLDSSSDAVSAFDKMGSFD